MRNTQIINSDHEPLRVPKNWTDQERTFVIQMERILDDVYNKIGSLQAEVKKLQEKGSD